MGMRLRADWVEDILGFQIDRLNGWEEIIMGLRQMLNKLLYGDPDPDATGSKSPAVRENWETLYNDPDTPSYGNPNGSVSLVEFVDYR